jgi:DNA-directed RNA polymerase subunit M/transcription elongation factor TFIIS
MIRKSFAYKIAVCEECNNILVYKIVDDIPDVCPHCGVPKGVTPTQQQRMQMEQAKQSGQRGTWTIRRG